EDHAGDDVVEPGPAAEDGEEDGHRHGGTEHAGAGAEPEGEGGRPPVKATWPRASPAKTWLRSTRKEPTRPAATPAAVPAAKAWRKKSCDSGPAQPGTSSAVMRRPTVHPAGPAVPGRPTPPGPGRSRRTRPR